MLLIAVMLFLFWYNTLTGSHTLFEFNAICRAPPPRTVQTTIYKRILCWSPLSQQQWSPAGSGQTVSSESKSGVSWWLWSRAGVLVAIQMWGSSCVHTPGHRRQGDETNISAHFGYMWPADTLVSGGVKQAQCLPMWNLCDAWEC